MLSFTQRRDLYGQFTNDLTATNLSFGDRLMNESEKRVLNKRAWDFTQRIFTQDTVASQQFYNVPVNYRRLIGNPTITVGDITYTPIEAPDREFWDRVTAVSNVSDIPQWFFIFNNQIGFYPTPANDGDVITFPYEIQNRDLSVPDYPTGTIASATDGDATITGTGTAWIPGMAGRFIRITEDNTADSGDNQWYEIQAITDGTNLELNIPYEGTTFSGATQTYILAQMTLLPNGYDLIPVYEAAEQYFIKTIEAGKADRFKVLRQDLQRDLDRDHGQKTSSVVIEEKGPILNPNLFVRISS